MVDCSLCGETDGLLRDCAYCTGTYCSAHSLPEKHGCPGLVEPNSTDNKRDRDTEGNDTDIPPKPDFLAEGRDETDRDEHTDSADPRLEPLDSSDITTYGSVDDEFEGSPDVAPDGSVADREYETTVGTSTERTTFDRIISALKFWT